MVLFLIEKFFFIICFNEKLFFYFPHNIKPVLCHSDVKYKKVTTIKNIFSFLFHPVYTQKARTKVTSIISELKLFMIIVLLWSDAHSIASFSCIVCEHISFWCFYFSLSTLLVNRHFDVIWL